MLYFSVTLVIIVLVLTIRPIHIYMHYEHTLNENAPPRVDLPESPDMDLSELPPNYDNLISSLNKVMYDLGGDDEDETA